LFVPPLPLPDLANMPSLEALANIPSVALLLARTQALHPRFQLTEENAADLAAICVRLDGLPLAIELAAARLKLLPPRDLLRRLDRRLTVLTSGPRDLPDRQQTLRATIDWSYRLLDTDEQLWFERCSVFVGGWTLAAAEGLHERLRWPGQNGSEPLDALAALVDKSLIYTSTDANGQTRFDLLETIREFAAERLQERGAFETVAQAHADYFHNLVEPWDFNAPEWIANIEHELDNLRAALRNYLSRVNGAELALRLGKVLVRFWYWRDQISEGRWWLTQLVAKSEGMFTELRADILNSSALFANVYGDATSATAFYEASLHISRQLGLLRPQTNSLVGLGTMYGRSGDLPRAIASFEESLTVARQIDNPNAISNACYMLAHALINEGAEITRGLALYEECLAVAHTHGLKVVESMTLAALGEAYVLTGQIERAAELLPLALRVQREMNATMAIGWTLLYLGILHYRQANYHDAANYLLESLEMAPHGGAQYIIPMALEGVAGVLSMRAQPEPAARLLGAAEAMRESINHQRAPIERGLYDEILATVRRQLASSHLRAAWKAGREKAVQQVIEEAKALLG
jgi:tetratricopeptide (TPR) repeat protein